MVMLNHTQIGIRRDSLRKVLRHRLKLKIGFLLCKDHVYGVMKKLSEDGYLKEKNAKTFNVYSLKIVSLLSESAFKKS